MVMTGCNPVPPSTLEGHTAMPDGQHVLVQGETNLPDQAQILVSLQAEANHRIVVQGLPLVKGGRFQTLLSLPKDVDGGTFQVRLSFSPKAFDWSRGAVLKVTGRKGEYLSGNWAVRDGDVTILQRDLPLEIPQDKRGKT